MEYGTKEIYKTTCVQYCKYIITMYLCDYTLLLLISRSCSSQFDHTRNHLVKMSYIFPTFLAGH